MLTSTITNREWIYYNYLLRSDLHCKQLGTIEPLSILESLVCSSVITRKNRFIDSTSIKINSLLECVTRQRPKLSLTTSFVSIQATVSRSRLKVILLFLYNYLYETGRFTLTPISAVQRQANFIVRDYAYLSNFLGITYDYFGWRFPLRFTFNFSNSLNENQFRFFFHLLIRTI